VPRCHTDEDLLARYVDVAEDDSSDWNHLSITGQAHKAEMRPVVVLSLGVPLEQEVPGSY
jgi:hypothetical protein